MTEKIKGGDQILNTDLTVNYDLKNKDVSENIPAGNLTRTSSSNKFGNYPVPRQVSVNGVEGEAPDDLHRRLLLEAASRAGLDGSEERQRFVERFLGGLKYISSEADPSKDDDTKVKTSDIKNQSFDYNLNPKEIEALRQLQADYKARGGQLGDGKVYDYSTEGRNLTPTEKRNGKRGITTEQWKMQDLLRKAQILPSAFGTPGKLRDLKHISGGELPDIPGKSAEDRARRSYRKAIRRRKSLGR